ncbi:hypothetical protein G7Y89_g2839 [Cudoniella acicularis]|uniref:Uncharacterized protein n=1 Tax=Cudoniella acicularis TaxID=354080 RepID=A0A8H4RUH2_9HELO|nr:hypothetical protein G7Y89_g2839 [Cudoniella acicularis]
MAATKRFYLRLENIPTEEIRAILLVRIFKAALKDKEFNFIRHFYEKYLPGTQLSEKGTPLLEDRTPLPDPNKDFDPNEKFDPNKYDIIPYLTKGLLYNTLPTLITGGSNLVSKLGVLNTESIAN